MNKLVEQLITESFHEDSEGNLKVTYEDLYDNFLEIFPDDPKYTEDTVYDLWDLLLENLSLVSHYAPWMQDEYILTDEKMSYVITTTQFLMGKLL